MARPLYKVPCRYENDIEIGSTVSVVDGEPMVDVYSGHDLELGLSPDEAESLAVALNMAAADARHQEGTAGMTDTTLLQAYVEGYFQLAKRTAWPTVARVAKDLGWTQKRVEETVDGDPTGRLMLTAYNTKPRQRLGEHFVEVAE